MSSMRPSPLSSKSSIGTMLSDLPLELLESVLMRSFMTLFSRNLEHAVKTIQSENARFSTYRQWKKSRESASSTNSESLNSDHRAYILLSSVCWCWWQTLHGWPESPTRHWLKHKIKKLVKCGTFLPLRETAEELHGFRIGTVARGGLINVMGVTQLHDIVYVVSFESSAVMRFSATKHRRMMDISIEGLTMPCDIVACKRTSCVYVGDYTKGVWRMSAGSAEIKHWLPKYPGHTFKPRALSVTSTRLLVTTSWDTNQLIQFDRVGKELRRVQLPDYMKSNHAVESPTRTFIIGLYNEHMKQHQVAKVNTGGEALCYFSSSRLSALDITPHIAVDSHGNVFVVECDIPPRILLLDAQLSLRHVIVDKFHLAELSKGNWPSRLCYREQSGQLLVGFWKSNRVAVFDVLYHPADEQMLGNVWTIPNWS